MMMMMMMGNQLMMLFLLLLLLLFYQLLLVGFILLLDQTCGKEQLEAGFGIRFTAALFGRQLALSTIDNLIGKVVVMKMVKMRTGPVTSSLARRGGKDVAVGSRKRGGRGGGCSFWLPL